MDSTDRLTLQDLADTSRVVARMQSRCLLAASVGGILFSILVAVLWLWVYPTELGIAIPLAGITWVAFGLPLLIHWLRHWRRVQMRLRSVEEQVRAGQVVYGSQVQF